MLNFIRIVIWLNQTVDNFAYKITTEIHPLTYTTYEYKYVVNGKSTASFNIFLDYVRRSY